MTDKTFTFTVEQIKAIYRAGIRRGEEVQSAYDWGSTASGWQYDELVSAIDDIVNENKPWGADDRVDWNTIKDWFRD